jgi:hypothetical protein
MANGSTAAQDRDEKDKRESDLRGSITKNLRELNDTRPPVIMPECADTVLSLIRVDSKENKGTDAKFVEQFNDYFRFGTNTAFHGGFWGKTEHRLTDPLGVCWSLPGYNVADAARMSSRRAETLTEVTSDVSPTSCCHCAGCVGLSGTRYAGVPLARLFAADVLWLHYMERMGLFQILGALMDDYATGGSLPIKNDGLPAYVLEIMIRQMKSGTGSMQRERVTAYRRALGWTTPTGRALGITSVTNGAFNEQFHRLVQSALQYYESRRLAHAITQSVASGMSVANETSISDTIGLVKQSFRAMDYGRVHQDTLTGIVWAIGTLGMIYEMRDDIGLPKSSMGSPDQMIPAAYDLLVAKRSTASNGGNRYTTHLTAATAGRRLLLDLQGMPDGSTDAGTKDVRTWLLMPETEAAFESYRTAHRSLTGIDLGAQSTRVGEAGATIAVPQEA